MKISDVFGLLAILFGVLVFVSNESRSPLPDPGVIMEGQIDCGKVDAGKELEFSIPLAVSIKTRIVSIKGDCSCLFVKAEDLVLYPGTK